MFQNYCIRTCPWFGLAIQEYIGTSGLCPRNYTQSLPNFLLNSHSIMGRERESLLTKSTTWILIVGRCMKAIVQISYQPKKFRHMTCCLNTRELTLYMDCRTNKSRAQDRALADENDQSTFTVLTVYIVPPLFALLSSSPMPSQNWCSIMCFNFYIVERRVPPLHLPEKPKDPLEVELSKI